MATYKSVAMLEELKKELEARLASLSLVSTSSFDSSGNPCLSMYHTAGGVAGEQNVFIRIKPVDSLQKDIVGNSQAVFTPHVVQVAYEETHVEDALTVNAFLTVLACLGLRGCSIEVWGEDHGTFPQLTTFNTAAKKNGSWEPSSQYPLMIGQ